ncbi:hypothetical protein QZH41_000090 [Actinostola sp. cb2023]|nr:hypothetical protein QZH41_000090 [Actinostola sp. cb2023]
MMLLGTQEVKESTRKHVRRRLEAEFGEGLHFVAVEEGKRKMLVIPDNLTVVQLARENVKLQEKQTLIDKAIDNEHHIIEAALCIREKLKTLEINSSWPPKPSELHDSAIDLPDCLLTFLRIVLTGNTDSKKELSLRVQRLIKSFGQDFIYGVSCGAKKPPKHVLLPYVIKSLTNNVELIQIINRFGHGISYTQLEEIDTALCLQKMAKASDDKAVLPENIHPHVCTSLAWDNIDRLEETLSGDGTSHRVNGIAVQPKVFGPHLPSSLDTAIEKSRKRTVTLPPTLLPVYNAGNRVGPPSRKYIEVTSETVLYNAWKKNLLWILARLHAEVNQNISSWTGFNISCRDDVTVSQDNIGYLTAYLSQMSHLEQEHPDVHSHLASGGFSVQIGENNPFGRIPVDQTCEETVNKDTQTPGGTKGFSLKPGAVSRYYMVAEYRSIFLSNLREMLHLKSFYGHTDLQGTRITRDEEDVKSLVDLLENTWINPFDPDTQELVSISTGKVAPPEVQEHLLLAREKGNTAYQEFSQQRIESSPPVLDFYHKMTKLKLKTFSDLIKKKTFRKENGKEIILKADRVLFGQMILIAQSRNLSMNEVLVHPLGPLPWSLATPDGSLRKTNKATLAKELQRNVPAVDIIPLPSATIIDGMALVQRLKGDHKTFSEVGDALLNMALNESYQSTRIDIVFDVYRSDSIKNSERQNRVTEADVRDDVITCRTSTLNQRRYEGYPRVHSELGFHKMAASLQQQRVAKKDQAKANVAAPSTRTLQNRATASSFSIEPELQLKEFNPKGRFWVKADAFDLKVALQESVKGLWNGDVDLGDGKLEELRREYDNRREDCKIKESDGNRMALEKKLRQQCDNLQLDIKFLSSGLVLAEQQYQKKFNAPNSSEKLLKTLCWERVEFSTLLTQAQSFQEKYENMISCLDPTSPRIQDVMKALKSIEKDMMTYLRNLFIKKRQPGATHVLLFLLSDERRNKKPFALPVQYVPYHSLRDQFLRDLTNNIKQEMMRMELKTVGQYSLTFL